ncbi:MAG: NAD(+) synthase [Bacteroidia bacterium]|nr:NAD(+) synthase [Bacteroidia bacterium]
MKNKEVIDYIVSWLKNYSERSKTNGFVIGISGGIDSALTSTLCAQTGKQVICLNMPIRQHKAEYDRGVEHIQWLSKNYPNVSTQEVDLTGIFSSIETTFPQNIQDWLTMANTRARLRMLTLYAFACNNKMLVAGTGNKVEDFGVGFFTKYGDGGVDLSPIADLMKSEVYALCRELGVVNSILTAKPTDGLWADGRSDEDQIGATYDELEQAMKFSEKPNDISKLSKRELTVLDIYTRLNKANQHKMQPVPVCIIPKELK